jgi:hypothetical protein
MGIVNQTRMSKTLDLNEKKTYQLAIHDNILIKLYSIHPSNAILYFTDMQGNKINIPDDISIYDVTNNTLLDPFPLPNSQNYNLVWTDNYIVKYFGEPVLELTSRRSWNLTSCCKIFEE